MTPSFSSCGGLYKRYFSVVHRGRHRLQSNHHHFLMLIRALLRPFTSPANFSRPFIANPTYTLTSSRSRTFSISYLKMAQEFKLKDITTLSDLKNTDKKEAEVQGIEGGKVLIVKVQDQVHALNANCTHFGAPLKNGVVTKEGRLTCPWHGGMLLLQLTQFVHVLTFASLLQCQDW